MSPFMTIRRQPIYSSESKVPECTHETIAFYEVISRLRSIALQYGAPSIRSVISSPVPNCSHRRDHITRIRSRIRKREMRIAVMLTYWQCGSP